MRSVACCIVAATLLSVFAVPVASQAPPADTAAVQEIHLADGSVVYGTLTGGGDPVRIRLLSGDVLEVPRAHIVSAHPARGRVVKGAFWREDPNRTRLFFGPTARGMRPGGGYVAAYEVVMPFIGVSLSDRFMLAGGTPFFGGFDGDRPYWVAPKLRVFSRNSTDVAVGALVFAVSDESFGVLYGVGSFGSPDKAVHLGLGYGFVNDEVGDRPTVMVGFEVRGSRSVKLLSENYMFPGGVGLLSIGPRFIGGRLSADLGLGIAFSEGDHATFPIVNFVYTW